MSAARGTFRLIYEDVIWFMGKLLLLYITLPLIAVWLIQGIIFEVEDAQALITGPAYFFIPFYGIVGFKSLLPIAIALTSTRTQVLKTFYAVGIVAVFGITLLINVGQYMLYFLHEQGISSVGVSHPGNLVLGEYRFWSYFGIELSIMLFLFGVMFLGFSLSYRLGMKRVLVCSFILFIACLFLYYLGAFQALFGSMTFSLEPTIIFLLLGVAGVICLLVTYPLMRNADLEPKGIRE